MDKKRIVHLIIMFVLTIGIGLLAPFGQITELGMKVLGVFIGVLYGWIFIDLVWPSVFGFVMLSIVGYQTAVGNMAAGFGNPQFLMVLVLMLFAGAFEEAGMTDFLANWFLKKEAIRKSPWVLVAGITFIAFVIGMLGGALAAVFLLWALVFRIADDCGISKHNTFISFFMALILFSACAGSGVIPFHSGALTYGGFLTAVMDVKIPYVGFFLYGLVTLALPVVILFLIGKYVMKLDASMFSIPQEIVRELEAKQTTKGQLFSFWLLIAFMVVLFLPELVPSLPGMKFISKLGLVGLGLIVLLIMAAVRFDGAPLISLERVCRKHVSWPLVLLLTITFPLANALKAEECGIMPTIVGYVSPIVSQMGLVPFMFLSIFVLGLLTQVTHNMVLGAMFIPFLCPLCEQLGGNVIVFWYMIYTILQCAYATPAASMQSAILHGHERIIKKDAYLFGGLFLIITYVILFTIGLPFGNLIF